MKKRGFTLVELLAVIVILAVTLAIAVPNVLGIIENTRKESFASTGKMMANAAKNVVTSEPKYVPSGPGKGRVIPWAALSLDNVSKDVDGGTYDTANCYVVVVNDNGSYRYFITLKGSKRAIDLKESTNISVDSDTSVTEAPAAGVTIENIGGVAGLDVTIEAAE
jgi:type IV pilus assembly protein PilA